jgi:ferredoxin-NADP reductase
LSAAPSHAGLRFTVKSRGDASSFITGMRPGTRVVVEGPYGSCTPEVIGKRRPLFVVGGVGVAPVRAMLERLAPNSGPVVLYRARHEEDLVHLDELRDLARRRGGLVYTLVGPTLSLRGFDPFSPESLRSIAPDLVDRVAVLCGPESLLHSARRGLLAAGVPSSRIHYERPWW